MSIAALERLSNASSSSNVEAAILAYQTYLDLKLKHLELDLSDVSL